jgi:imidazole glycerol-phosphate synthase subunit HisF
LIPRIIPCLLLSEGRLVKTTRFRDPRYVGDPINAVRIFNEKQVDELVVLDIGASVKGIAPDYSAIEEIVTEAFMPVAYGGGISGVAQANRIIQLGVEKVVVNTAAVERPSLVHEITDRLGTSTLVVSIDATHGDDGYEVITHAGTRSTGRSATEWAMEVAAAGAGEILLSSIDRDGTRAGYDLDLISAVASSVRVPVVASGGAGNLEDLAAAIRQGGASAAAAGSLFVFHGPHRAVLITYPAYERRKQLFDLMPSQSPNRTDQ